MELGEIISKGDTLFKIDPRNYQASLSEARAAAQQWKNTILRLEKQSAIDQDRLKTLERNRELARAEFERTRQLFESDSVGTRSGVDAAERSYNSVADQADQMAQAIELYPIQIKEAENSLTAAQARQKLAAANLERCQVRSPFNGRVKDVSLEAGQYVSPGISVLTLADDSVLEIRVPLDSRDARQWLRFDGENPEETAWFSTLSPVQCRIHWTENQSGHHWKGQLHRVVNFEQQTRTLTVAIRVDAKNASSANGDALPLVDGMFCSVEIPGRTLHKVIRLPRWAVTFENTVHVASDNRLKTIPVEVARVQGEETFVSAGLSPGDIVITTRLADPLENALLKITNSME
jgi:RND family efflux transporter MFP subunit